MKKIAIGRVQRSHGLRGFFKVSSYSGELAHFKRLEEVFLRREGEYLRYRVRAAHVSSHDIRLQLEGLETPEMIKPILGAEIWVDRQFACPLGEEEYYASDLAGCEVFRDETRLGTVTGVVDGADLSLLEVRSGAEKTVLVPFTRHFVGEIDTESRKIFLKGEYPID